MFCLVASAAQPSPVAVRVTLSTATTTRLPRRAKRWRRVSCGHFSSCCTNFDLPPLADRAKGAIYTLSALHSCIPPKRCATRPTGKVNHGSSGTRCRSRAQTSRFPHRLTHDGWAASGKSAPTAPPAALGSISKDTQQEQPSRHQETKRKNPFHRGIYHLLAWLSRPLDPQAAPALLHFS
jgi:hypothetical protein